MNTFLDDYMFPVTAQGLRSIGVLESACGTGEAKDKKNKQGVFEDAVSSFARSQARSDAMASVLYWVEEGEYTYDTLDEILVVVADIDGDDEITGDEEARYNDIWREIPDAMLTLGCDESDIETFVNGTAKKADSAAARIGAFLSIEMDTLDADDDDLITSFAVGEDAVFESAAGDDARIGVLEATYKRRKVVRDGKVEVVNKRVSGRTRQSAKQKFGMRKARRKAHSASANLSRKKSMKMRDRRGL